MNKSIEISGELVIPGTKVNVKWLDNWHEGKVLEIEYENYLYKIRDSNAGTVILLDKSQFKVIDTSRPSHYQLTPGTEVAFYDNNLNNWIPGIIEVCGVKPGLLVKWNKNESSTSINWFEIDDVAPIISNEAFGMEGIPGSLNIQLPSSGQKNTTLDDILNERPHNHQNELFQNPPLQQEPFENRLPSYKNFVKELDSPFRVKPHRTSVSMKQFYSSNFSASKTKDSKLDKYLENQAALLHGKIDHSLLPPVWSYISHPKGIPHHPSSRFFRRVTSDSRLPGAGQRGITRAASADFKSKLTKSPTVDSQLVPYAQLTFPQRSMKRGESDMTTRPLPPLPDSLSDSHYEVPLPLSSPASLSNLQLKSQPNPYSRLSTHAEEFDVNAPTIVSTSKSEMVVSAGGTVTLFCKATSEAPIILEWTKNGKRLTHNDDRVAFPAQDKLQLYGMSMADAGIYQCRVRNEGGTATYTCKIDVEEDTIKRSFSREYGLDDLAKALPTPEDFDLDNISLTDSLEEESDPKISEFPLNTARYPLSLTSMKDSLLDQEETKPRVATESFKEMKTKETKKKEPKNQTKTSSSKIEERKTNKGKRRRVSNVLMTEVNDYLEGYGEDYGNMTDDVILMLGEEKSEKKKQKNEDKSDKKKSKKKSKSKAKQEKKKKAQVNDELSTKSKQKKTDTKANEILMDDAKVRKPQVDDNDDDDLNLDEFEASLKQNLDLHDVVHSSDIIVNGYAEDSAEENINEDSNPQTIQIEAEVHTLTMEYEEGMIREAGEGESLNQSKDEVSIESVEDVVEKKATSEDSMNALPSYESLLDDDGDEFEVESKEREDGEGEEQGNNRKISRESGGNVDLPLEKQHYTEAVRRLQESAEEYEQERFGKDERRNGRSKGIGKIFKSSNKPRKVTII